MMANSSHNKLNSSSSFSRNNTYNKSYVHCNKSDEKQNMTVLSSGLTSGGSSYLYNIPVEVLIIVYIFLFILALVGNSIVLHIVVNKRRMQTFTNWLILNLAIADLLVALFCIPLEIPLEINGRNWIYGKGFCVVFYPIQTAMVYGSVFTLTALSFSRYWAIIHPFRKQPNSRFAKILIGVIWICSIVFIAPYMSVLNLEKNVCGENWTNKQRRIYTVVVFVFQYVLPISIMTVAYSFIIYDLFYSKNGEKMNKTDKRRYLETRRVVRLLVVVTSTFAICILPYHVLYLIIEFYGIFQYFDDVFLISYFILYLNSALNPILYNAFNEGFHKEFLKIYRRLRSYISNPTYKIQESFFTSRRSSSRTYEEEYRYSQHSHKRSSIDVKDINNVVVHFNKNAESPSIAKQQQITKT